MRMFSPPTSSVFLSLIVLALPVAFLSGCSEGGRGPSASRDGVGNTSSDGTDVVGVGGNASGGQRSGSGGTSAGGTSAAGGNQSNGGSRVTTGGGGSSAAGGDPGSGGTSMTPTSICMVGDPNSIQSELIDDMESDSGITGLDGAGSWFASNDGMTQQTPSAGSFVRDAGLEGPGAMGSAYALHSTAEVSDGADWGATVQLDFDAAVNASQWAGVKFWAKGSGSPRFNVVSANTLPSEEGGTCSGECYDSHGIPITLREDWTEVKVLFEDLSQEGFGTPADFDPSTVLAIAVAAKDPGSYDIWLDDVRFFTEQGMPDCENYPGDSRCEATESYCAECSDDPRCECVLNECVETGVIEGPLSCNQQVMNTRQGGSTRYWINQASSDRDTSGGYEALGCGFPVISKGFDEGSAATQDRVAGAPGDGRLFGALNSTDFGADAALCGACVLINESVKIQIVDECPNRPGAQGNPACTQGHIDLSVAAANQVGGDNPNISWRVVPCDNEAPEYFWHWDSNNFWGALSIAGLRWPAARVELKDGDTWLEGRRKDYWGAWVFGQDDDIPDSSGSVPPPPWTVRITDIHGQVMQDQFDSPNGQIPNPVENGTAVPYPSQGMVQLPLCGM